MKLSFSALFLALLLALSGCISSDTLIKVSPDGSGKIIQTTLISSVMLEQMKAMMSGMAEQLGGKEAGKDPAKLPDMFSESEARAKSVKLGEGVTFVSSRKLKTDRSEGIEAIYSFKDITKLKISEKPSAPGSQGKGMAPGDAGEDTTFRFERLPNGHALLTAVFPQKNLREKVTSPQVKELTKKEVSKEQLEQAKMIFNGLRFGIKVDVQGDLIQTNSPYAEGSKVTLLEMDFAELLNNEDKLKEMSGLKDQSLDDAKHLLKDLKGFKINLDPEVKIEFAGR